MTDGAVLPILHLNGAKIANPTILARKTDEELANYFNGLGWEPFFIEGNDPEKLNPVMAEKWIKQSRKSNPSKKKLA